MFLFVYITRLIYREVRYISKGHIGVLCSYTICSRHGIAEIQQKLALDINQSINLQIPEKKFRRSLWRMAILHKPFYMSFF